MKDPAVRALTLCALLTCLGTPAGYGQDGSDSDVRSKIIAMEHVWNQACQVKDLKALDRILDNDFVFVDADGRLLTKPEVLADVKASAAVHVISDALVVHVHGDTAVITGTYRMSGVEGGKAFVRSGRFVDTWLYRNGLWFSIASLATPIEE